MNPDGGHYSFYDFGSKRRNMSNYCVLGQTSGNVGNRNNWGVDLNRNSSVGSMFDGYSGASASCTSDTSSGPFELSEPEIRNEKWVVRTSRRSSSRSTSTRTAATSCGPRARTAPDPRTTLPPPNIGIENYFFEVSETILSHIKDSRDTVLLPERTGPIVRHAVLGRRQLDRRAVVPPRHHRLPVRGGRAAHRREPDTGAIQRRDVGFQPCFGGPGTSGSMGTNCGTVDSPTR